MSVMFCTSCGQGLALETRFCDSCGEAVSTLDKSNETPLGVSAGTGEPASEAPAKLPLQKTRTAISTWLAPFNAALFFGGTLASVFDFLSPRVALLPIAATIAVVGLLVSVLLRKYVAPSLQEASKLRRLLAPDGDIHKSPLLIVTAVLSTLMVTGAAWSGATSATGGVIASKFDAARNAQMQLGVMQGLQKEQRVQTAVLEDIREGRASNPRRELANQGTAWTEKEFSEAITRGDTQTVSLFLAGGMKWRLHFAQDSLKQDNKDILEVLLQHSSQLDLRGNDCETLMDGSARAVNENKDEPDYQIDQYGQDSNAAHILTALEKKFLKKFCSQPKDVAYASTRVKNNVEINDAYFEEYKRKLAELMPFAQCQSNLRERNSANDLFDKASNVIALDSATGSAKLSLMATAAAELMTGSSQLTPKVRAAINEYCQEQASVKPFKRHWKELSRKQVLEAIR